MNHNLEAQEERGTAAQRQPDLPSRTVLAGSELSQAIGKHAIVQAQLDVKITSHLVEIRDQLRSTQIEVESLRARMDQFDRDLAPRKQTARNSSR